MDRLTTHNSWRLDLHSAGNGVSQRALAIDRITEGVHHPAEETVSYWERKNVASSPDGLALLDVVNVAENDRSNGILVQVEGKANRSAFELQQVKSYARNCRPPGLLTPWHSIFTRIEHP